MASISTDKAGNRRILFFSAAGDRKALRLGRTPMKAVETVKRMVELIVSAQMTQTAPANEVSRWLAGLDEAMLEKLAAVGLAEAPQRTTLELFVSEYIGSRIDVKANTLRAWRQAQRLLVEHFGANKPLQSMTKGDGKSFRLFLLGKGFAEASVRKYCGFGKHFLNEAVDRELIDRNPFSSVPSSSIGNEKRQYFVSREETAQVIAACPDVEWRLIIALSRYGGLRCPSEHLALRWEDIHWDQKRFTVRSPKTEKYQGHDSRLVPIFPELLPFLEEAFDRAEVGAEFVVTRYREAESNLRTTLAKIIRRAALKPWPRIFHNMRSSRQTELEARFPTHVVCRWIGNSPMIARKHYLQTIESDFERAVSEPCGDGFVKAAQNPAQYTPANAGIGSQSKLPKPAKTPQNIDTKGLTTGADGNRTHLGALQPPRRV